jgi:Holliday junction resolvase RusA-like endonuclease
MYTPSTAKYWKEAVQVAIMHQEPSLVNLKKPGPVELFIRFNMPRPRSHKQKVWVLDPRKPDVDNLVKAVMDALTTVGVWKDDSQVAKLTTEKWICIPEHEPGAIITFGWI